MDWSDKEGFIEVIQDIEGDVVDVFLHSPGGLAEATDSLVDIIRGRLCSKYKSLADLGIDKLVRILPCSSGKFPSLWKYRDYFV